MSATPTELEAATAELERMVAQQRERCLEIARRLRPGLTADDITQPHDFAELAQNWHFNYEDGMLAGLLAAELTLRRVGRKFVHGRQADSRPPGK